MDKLNDVTKAANLDSAWSRMAVLSGGAKARIVAFDFDAVSTNSRYTDGGNIGAIISQAELSELLYLAGFMCAEPAKRDPTFCSTICNSPSADLRP